MDHSITLALLVVCVLVVFAVSVQLLERVERFVGLTPPRIVRYILALLVVFLAYQGWQNFPARYIPRFLAGESQAVVYGVAPISKMECPGTHPIKGDNATLSVGTCIYRLPGDEPYNRTRPGRCYATVEDAKRDGCTASTF